MPHTTTFKPGQPAIYRVEKHSVHPGPRAERIDPAPRGEEYRYEVDKFWRVDEVRPDGKVYLRTRRGKQRVVPINDPHLRKPTLWERILYRDRFPAPPEATPAHS